MYPEHAAEMQPLADGRPAQMRVLPWSVITATILGILGLFALWPSVYSMWAMWTTDALKSIGMIVPPVSLVLTLRAWRRLGWEMEGSWWGLPIILVLIVLVHIRETTVLAFILSPQWTIYIPPQSFVVAAYGFSLALLFGGMRLVRAALFPLALLWFVNPVPHVFNVLVDLPLQHASAYVARAFAHALGQPLTPDQMRLMFTPEFGMFIAPGCNGIRGAVTMGLIALIAGYVYRFRLRMHVLFVAAAILLGYVFNFVRLCVLVLYYIAALHFTSWQAHGEGADYAIGGCLFFIATMLLFTAVQRFRTPQTEQPSQPPVAIATGAIMPRMAALAIVLMFGSAGYLYGYVVHPRVSFSVAFDYEKPGPFPQKLGIYSLSRTWDEYITGQAILFYWADYAPADNGAHVQIGIAPYQKVHDTLSCHSARGEDPLWVDTLTMPMYDKNANFSASFFNGGSTQYVEATTLCTNGTCDEANTGRTHFGLLYSHLDGSSLLGGDPQRQIPIMLKAETLDTQMPPELAREQLLTSLRVFLSNVSLPALVEPYRKM